MNTYIENIAIFNCLYFPGILHGKVHLSVVVLGNICKIYIIFEVVAETVGISTKVFQIKKRVYAPLHIFQLVLRNVSKVRCPSVPQHFILSTK